MGISWSEKTRKEFRMALPADGKQMQQFQTMVESSAEELVPGIERGYDDFYRYEVDATEFGNTLVIWFYVSRRLAGA